MKLNAPKGAKGEKKNTQTVAVQEPLPEGAVVIDSGRFKYLVDVYQESSLNCNNRNLINFIIKFFNNYFFC